SNLNGYKITKFPSLSCNYGSNVFHLFSDDLEGAAIAKCISCGNKIDILESEKYSDDLLQNVCRCENAELSLGIGSALYPNSSDIRWVYVGAHCAECGLSGVYVDWQER
ncbi:hypothetical protein, partial [Roseibium sp.]|uniref:hypothetical protein n=1 Tax=Roseibium sp. TaxID=1936156 RepID=UPI003D0E0ECA